MSGQQVVTCLHCSTLLTLANQRGRVGEGVAKTAQFDCDCGATVTVVARKALPRGDALVDYRKPF